MEVKCVGTAGNKNECVETNIKEKKGEHGEDVLIREELGQVGVLDKSAELSKME